MANNLARKHLLLGLALGALVALIVAGWSYVHVAKALFIIAVIAFGFLLIAFTTLSKKQTIWFSLLNVPAFLALCLPVADLLVKPAEQKIDGKPAYSLALAKQQGGGSFGVWWSQFSKLWTKDFREKLVEPDPDGILRYVPRVNACMPFLEGKVCTNSVRLIGPELVYEKGKAFRILAIGESTTQGVPLDAEYLPWPRVLEQLIGSHLACSKPVEILNGGVAGYTIRDNNLRMASHLATFDPDVILSLHGANSYPLLFNSQSGSSPITGNSIKLPPRISERPSYLIRQLEFRWLTREFYRTTVNWSASDKDILKTDLALEYGKLAKTVSENNKKMFFLTYNLAINESSPEEAVLFYKQGFPLADAAITMNNIQTKIMRTVGEQYGVSVIDTSKGLNGTYDLDNFIDLVHFTKKGDRIMAKNVFDGLVPYLMTEPELLCRRK